jgi:peptide/nickel transport system ATP-binding protein
MENTQLLSVENLSVDYKLPAGRVHALRNVSVKVQPGEILSIVGESGSGKSTLALAIASLLSFNSIILPGSRILFKSNDITLLSRSQMDRLRGTGIFMVFQNPFMSLNPLMKIGDQLKEAIRVRIKRAGKKEDNEKITLETATVLSSVKIGDAEDVMRRYPHQLSGGQNQRVMLAMALAEKPGLLIADEPTTALDVTTQAQVLVLLKEIVKETGMSVIFITHDLAVAGSISDSIAVLYGGMVQEIGSAEQILFDPKHPYTAGLINSIPGKTKFEGPLEAIRGSFTFEGVESKCAFTPRCPLAHDECEKKVPALIELGSHRYVRCVNYGEAEEDAEI